MKKAIIVTGISSGLGRETFGALIGRDAHIFGISRRFLKDQEESQRMRADISLLTCDLGNHEMTIACADALSRQLEDTEKIVFINNACSIDPIGQIGDFSNLAIHRAIETNITSAIILINALCSLKKASALTFINVTSGAANTPIVGWAPYCSAKAAMRMFFSVLKEQSRTDPRIIVHEFEPGIMDTNMQEKIRRAPVSAFPAVQKFKIFKDSGRLRDPAAVALELIENYVRL